MKDASIMTTTVLISFDEEEEADSKSEDFNEETLSELFRMENDEILTFLIILTIRKKEEFNRRVEYTRDRKGEKVKILFFIYN